MRPGTSRLGTSGYRRAVSRLDRITSDLSICHGQPTVRGLRYPVENLLALLSSGMTIVRLRKADEQAYGSVCFAFTGTGASADV